MSHEHAHGQTHHDLLEGLTLQLQPLLESSQQAIYLYFDDEEKVCNEKFASLLGYGSTEEWAQMEGSFPSLFVDDQSQDELIEAYQNAMQKMTNSPS